MLAFRYNGASRHDGGPIESSPRTPWCHCAVMFNGFQEGRETLFFRTAVRLVIIEFPVRQTSSGLFLCKKDHPNQSKKNVHTFQMIRKKNCRKKNIPKKNIYFNFFSCSIPGRF